MSPLPPPRLKPDAVALARLRKAAERAGKIFGVTVTVEEVLEMATLMFEEAVRRATDASNPQDQKYTRELFPKHLREMKEEFARIQKLRTKR